MHGRAIAIFDLTTNSADKFPNAYVKHPAVIVDVVVTTFLLRDLFISHKIA